jgi:hypothetical protein
MEMERADAPLVRCLGREVSTKGTALVRCRYPWGIKERSMANNKNPNEKQPGEKEPGKFHYNPGNQSGKTVENIKPETERENNVDRIQSRHEREAQKR